MALIKDHLHEVDDADETVIAGPVAANVAAIADTSVATAEAVGDAVNATLTALKDAGLMKADAP